MNVDRREPWGHQVIEKIPLSQVRVYRRRGRRIYDPDWENGPQVFLLLLVDPVRRWLEEIRLFLGGGERT